MTHDARLLVVDAREGMRHIARESLVDVLRPGDLVVANDAATLPASLHGTHIPASEPSAPTAPASLAEARTTTACEGGPIEVRLAGRAALSVDIADFSAVVFGAGDFHLRTEDRPLPSALAKGDRLVLGPLSATVTDLLGHPRLVALHFDGTPDEIWAGLARHGKPIQYAHVPVPLVLWDVWTPIASPPVAFEPPSAGFAIDWHTIAALRARGIGFSTITHAAGISSTGDPELDKRLPFDEPYDIPASTARAIAATRAKGGRIVAIGTTVVRALEHAAARDGVVHAGPGIATQRIGPATRLRIVDAILTGVHEPGTSHHELLRAFVDDETLAAADEELAAHDYRPHEFGDSVFVIPAGGSTQQDPPCITQSRAHAIA
jgi:S-adenosylmethionine:tRNA ribosyltransferase-isomerase